MSARPLAGLRVVDLTTVVVGPACTARLAAYGADVIKVEPLDGDLLRSLGGPSPTGRHGGMYLQLNQGKRTTALDLKDPAARAALGGLLAGADVLVANMRIEPLERMGLGPDALRAAHPRLIHCIITGFGSDGPYAGQPAYDSVVQGVAGIAGLTAEKGGVPSYVPLVVCDHVVAEITAGAIMAALVARERTGEGAAIEVPMHETMAAFVLQEHLGPASFEPALGPPGDRRLLSPDAKPIATADGWLSLTVNSDRQCAGLLRAIGRDDLLDDPRFATVAARFRHVDAWMALRVEALRERTTAEWLATFARLDVPAMPCHDLAGLLADPHLVAVGLVAEAEHPTEGPIRHLRPTVRVDGRSPEAGAPAAPLGWHTRDVLRDAGLAPDAVDALIASGAAVATPERERA